MDELVKDGSNSTNNSKELLEVMVVPENIHCSCVSKVCFVSEKNFENVEKQSFLIESPAGGLVLTAEKNALIPKDFIALTEVTMHNTRMVSHQKGEFKLFEIDRNQLALQHVLMDLRLRFVPTDQKQNEKPIIDVSKLIPIINKQLFRHCLSVNEILLFEFENVELVARVLSIGLDSDENDEKELEQHSYRGVCVETTKFYIQSLTEQNSGIVLENVVELPQSKPKSCVCLISNDGEEFIIKKRVLKPCIALTKYVRDQSDELPKAPVDVDCLILDRCLIYLELYARDAQDKFSFPISIVNELQTAADTLGCKSLSKLCASKLGEFESRIRYISWKEVLDSQKEKRLWILIDGAVFDLTDWLAFHPGGSKIIPKQALGVDSTVFFEIYHSSRESFSYLKEFYIGELLESDLPLVPAPNRHTQATPSSFFLDALRKTTYPYRLGKSSSFKSF